MRGYEKGNEGKGEGGEFAGNTAIRRTDGKKETGRKKGRWKRDEDARGTDSSE